MAILGGPKMGNLKDPAKIAAKQAEWEETASTEALKSRYVSKVSKWRLSYPDCGSEVAAGDTSLSMVTALISEYLADTDNTVFFGFGARRRVSQAVLSCLAGRDGQSKIPNIPHVLWDFPLEETRGVVVDPLSKLKWVGEEYEDILRHFALPENTYQLPIEEQERLMRGLWERLQHLTW